MNFKDRVGEVLSGIVKRIEFGNIIVDLGKAEGFLRKDELIPGKILKMEIVLELIFLISKKKLKVIKSFYQEHILNLWQNYLNKKSQKFMRVK